MNRFKFDLGVRALFPEWKAFFNTDGIKEDAIAGLTVACIAIPLSLAIAMASGVSPSIGLITGIVGSIVCGLFGGTTLAVSGPAAAMAVLVASVIQRFGLGGLLCVTFGCGLLQILTGIFKMGSIARYVPIAVIAGFTAGIGALIFIGQLPRALGLPASDQSHIFDVIVHVKDLIFQAKASAILLVGATMSITIALPKVFPRLPAPLFAVIIPSLIAYKLGIAGDTIGEIHRGFPTPEFPRFSDGNFSDLTDLLWTTGIVFALASLETLLSSSTIDRMTKGTHHDPDQEMIGQGLGNIAVSLFGGIPVTSVIARSTLNVQAGAKTRRAAVIQGLIVALAVLLFAPYLSEVPVAVIAGILLSIALRMMHPREFLEVWRSSPFDGLVYLMTFVAIVGVDLVEGVQAGIVAALLVAAVRFGAKARTVREHDHAEKGMDRLVHGVERFRSELQVGYKKLFENLASGQTPHTLFITCSDSRINPNLITSTDPGELFIVRNVGNMVPPFEANHHGDYNAEGAAIEYAVEVLGVKEIVVCGHSYCGAMAIAMGVVPFNDEKKKQMPSLATWLKLSEPLQKALPKDPTPEKTAEINALLQLENLKTYPIVKNKLAQNKLRLHAWFYSIGTAELKEWDESQNLYVQVGAKISKRLERRIHSGLQFQSPFLRRKSDK